MIGENTKRWILRAILLCVPVFCLIPVAWGGESSAVSNLFTIDNRTSGDLPVVTGVSSPYCSYSKDALFLAGVSGPSADQSFTATINWNGFSPSQVRWYRNTSLIATDSIGGTSVSRTFNVGTAFSAGDRLYVQAIAANGKQSARIPVNFQMISAPPGLSGILSFQNGKYKSLPFNIGFPEIKKDAPKLTDKNNLAEVAQIDWMSIIEVTAEIDLKGHCEIKAGSDYMKLSKEDFKLSGLEIGGKLKVVMTMDYSGGRWNLGGGFDLSVFGEYTSNPTYYVFMVGPIPVPTYYRFSVDASVAANCRFTDGSADHPVFSGTIPVEAGLEGMAGAGIADALALEGYLRGDLNFEFQLPQEPFLKDWYLELTGGIRIYLWFYKFENDLLSFRWPEETTPPPSVFNALKSEGFEPMSRNYLQSNYAQWYGGTRSTSEVSIPPPGTGGTEITLQTNIFGQSNPVLAVSGNTKCLVWLYDEPSRNSLDRTMLVYSVNSGGGWSTPKAIQDDGTADAMPAMTLDTHGNFVCVWVNASQLIPDGTSLTGFADKLDIRMGIYNLATDLWTAESVTQRPALDYNPKVACQGNGNITVIWTHDDKNDILAENPPVTNSLIARTKTDTGWTDEQTIATVNGIVKYSDLAALAGYHLVYCVDSDSDFQTDTDNELYYINNRDGVWSNPVRLTQDGNSDVNPRLVKTTSGLMLLWAREGKIVSTTDIPGMTGIAEVVPQSGSSGQRGFVAAVSPSNNVSVVWNDPSSAGSDLYMATYDPTIQRWSNVIQITDNRDMERSIIAVYSTANQLDLAYDKVHILPGEGLVTFGQVDLCVYDYQVGSDLSVVTDSITISNPDAVPGDTVSIQATIFNIGDVAIGQIPVAFYCGDTAIPANQIGQRQTITNPLGAGDSALVSVSWTIPISDKPLKVIVVIDPDLQIEDKNRPNNSASEDFFGANLTVGAIEIDQSLGGYYFKVEVLNDGFVASPEGVKCTLTSGSDHLLLDTTSVPAISSKQAQSITLFVSSDQLQYGSNSLTITVDSENIVSETNETDNSQSTLLLKTVPYDLVMDGVINLLDLELMVSEWMNSDGNLFADIGPFGGDGRVDLSDLEILAQHWLEDVSK